MTWFQEMQKLETVNDLITINVLIYKYYILYFLTFKNAINNGYSFYRNILKGKKCLINAWAKKKNIQVNNFYCTYYLH